MDTKPNTLDFSIFKNVRIEFTPKEEDTRDIAGKALLDEMRRYWSKPVNKRGYRGLVGDVKRK